MRVEGRAVRVGVLWEIGVVRVSHPDPVWVPWQVVLGNPSAATLRTATVKEAGDWVGILLALTLLGCLHPFNGVSLGPDSDTAPVLEDHHDDDAPECQDR